jgi:hypothetical protein
MLHSDAPIDIDAVRLELERDIAARLTREFHAECSRSLPDSDLVRRLWLADSVGFSPTLAQRARALVERGRERLCIQRPVELYLSDEGYACIALTHEGALHVRVNRLFLEDTDAAACLFVVGHELGHHLGHERKPGGPDPFLLFRWLAEGRRAGTREVAAAYCRAAELTSDRIGLLVTQDFDAALRVLMALRTGKPASEHVGCEEAFLKEANERVQLLLRRPDLADGDTHPETLVRAYALAAYRDTDAYAALTGEGSRSLDVRSLERTLKTLVGPSLAAEDQGLPPIETPLIEQAVSSVRQRSHALRSAAATAAGHLIGGLIGSADRIAREARHDRPSVEVEEEELDDLERRFRELERQAQEE